MNILEYADSVIISGDIELIKALFQLSLVLKVGAVIRKKIEAEVNHLNPYSTKVNSFQELVYLHEHETSPLQDLMSSNGWLVIEDNHQLPWTFDKFLSLFQKTKFRGLRILPSLLDDGETSLDQDQDPAKIESRRFAIVRKSRKEFSIVFYAKEFFKQGRDDDDAEILVFSESKDIIELTYENYAEELKKKKATAKAFWNYKDVSFPAMDIISRFFGGEDALDYSLHFVTRYCWDLLLDVAYEKEKDLLVFRHLRDDGELAVWKDYQSWDDGEKKLAEIDLDFYVITNENWFINICERDLKKYYIPYEAGSLHALDISKLYAEDYPNLTEEEQYSLYSYMMKTIDNYVPVPNEITFKSDEMKNINYGCYDTGADVLCLVSDIELESNKEFEVVHSYRQNDFIFHEIRLL